MIEASHVFKTYPSQVVALSDLSLQVSPGEFVVLSGPSGSGKSTLLRILFGAEKPDEGEVVVNGICLTRRGYKDVHRLRKTMGIVLQDFKLLRDRTVEENIAFALEATGHLGGETGEKISEVLKRVDLLPRVKDPICSLSAGEQQRVAIARALVNDPPLILADEPTGNLDRRMAHEVLRILGDLNLRGATIFLATHQEDLIEGPPYRVIRLSGGRIESPPEKGMSRRE
jgi:cell division transport system ATP-binding protein